MDETSCTYDKCKAMCQRPCWPKPEEVLKLIENGYGNRLMLDYWAGTSESDYENIYIICPALKTYESKMAPFWPTNDDGCTFWNKTTGLCELHNAPSKDNSNLKPYEARMSSCKDIKNSEGLHEKTAMM